MESEKVKEIKENLKEEIHLVEYVDGQYANNVSIDLLKNILTYINELESENKDLQDLCNKTYDDLTKEIDRLENENVELKVDLKNSIDMQKQMLDGFKTTIKEVEENIAREIPNLLKQFAERVKMEFYYEFDEIIPSIMSDKIDKILKELIEE